VGSVTRAHMFSQVMHMMWSS